MTDVFTAPHFHDDNEARKTLEALLWPDGPVCPHCGVVGHAYATKRAGVYRCAEKVCRKDFTVTMKTVMERSQIALHKWLQAFHLIFTARRALAPTSSTARLTLPTRPLGSWRTVSVKQCVLGA